MDGQKARQGVGELLSALSGLESSKATERKRCATLLIELLKKPDIIDHVAQCTGEARRSHDPAAAAAARRQRSSGCSWSQLLRSVVQYMHLESEAIGRLEETGSTSASAQSSRRTRRKDIGELFKVFARASGKRPSNFNVTELLSHVTHVLRDGRLVEWFGREYVSVLTSSILTVPHFLLQISPQKWEELLALHCELFLSPPSSLDQTQLATSISTLLLKASLQCDLPTTKLYTFFSQLLPKTSYMKQTLLSLVLSTVNCFAACTAQNCRGRLCRLGEGLVSDLTHLWSKCQPAVLEHMVEFFRSQVRVHHPRGAYTDATGAWATNDVVWKRSLSDLFQVLFSDIEAASNRVKCKGDSGLKFEVADLTVDVLRQMLYLEDAQAASDLTEHRGKRFRRQSIWSRVMEGLSVEGPATVLWLQLVGWLLSKWSGSLPLKEACPLLSLLVRLLVELKRTESVQWVLVCLQVLALSPDRPPSSRELWSKAWHTTIKLLSVQGAQQQGYYLLTVLLQQRLVECDLEPWRLFQPALNQPSRPVVSFLCGILCHHTIPEALPSFLATPTATPTGCDFPFRSHLLHFLLPTNEEWAGHYQRSHDPSTMDTVSSENRPAVALLAHTLVALTQRSCDAARIPVVRALFLPANHSVYVSQLLDPARQAGSPEQQQEEEGWAGLEGVYLQSTFDQPLSVSCPGRKQSAQVTLSKESPMVPLQALLLDLLAQRSEQLLQMPQVFELTSPARERSQAVSALLGGLAHHCGLVVNVLLVLTHCQACPPDQLRSSHAVRSLPDLLKRISACLKDPVWNELERVVYYKTAASAITSLHSLVHFPHLTGEGRGLQQDPSPSPSVSTALQAVAEALSLALPVELLETICSLAQGKWPLPPAPPSLCSSTFSLYGSSHPHTSTSSLASHPHTSTSTSPSSCSPCFEDDTDLGEGDATTSSTPGETCVTNLSDLVSPSFLTAKTSCQLAATELLCRLHLALSWHSPDHPRDCFSDQGQFKILKTTLSALLNVEGCSFAKPFEIQLFFKICDVFGSSLKALDVNLVDAIMGTFGQVLSVHHKNPCVLRAGLKLLCLLAPHFMGREAAAYSLQCCSQILRSFWAMYMEGRLPAFVRIGLAKFLQVLLELAGGSNIVVVKDDVTLREAIVCMVSDPDHAVRLHMAGAVTTLFLSNQKPRLLLPQKEQKATFKQISDTLDRAHVVTRVEDELSAEDDAVNRVCSLIATLQHVACTSPACEVGVVSMLVSAVGRGNISAELVSKALLQVATYLGYHRGVRHFLEDMLVSVLVDWLREGLPLTAFPGQLMHYDSQVDFFRTYVNQLVPHFVFQCDRSALEELSGLLGTPTSQLLRASLSESMVLILTCYAGQPSSHGEGGEVEVEGRSVARARDAHSLLVEYLSKEVVSQDVSVDVFVVELLSRMFEPPDAGSQLSCYSLPSDPEPCAPCFSSHTVQATLDYLPSYCGSTAKRGSFVRLLSQRKDHIQRILLSLAVQVETTHRPHKKRRLFLAYSLFVSLVCRELKNELGVATAFVVMDIIHTIVRILVPSSQSGEGSGRVSGVVEVGREGGGGGGGEEEVEQELLVACCDTLMEICKATMEACPEELCKYLSTVAGALLPYAQQATKEGAKALTILTYVVTTLSAECEPDSQASQHLAAHVTKLDPFPNVKCLKSLYEKQAQLRDAMGGVSLVHEIERFLSVRSQPFSRAEGLRQLGRMLHTSKLELAPLKEGGGAVVRLIRGLVGMCCSSGGQPSTAMKGATEAARCLGEIGPLDLHCIALPPLTDSYISFGCDQLPASSSWIPSMRRTIKILHSLTGLLMDRDVAVVQASGDCLRAVLATKSGAAVLQKVERELGMEADWTALLEPFKQQHRKKRMAAVDMPAPEVLSQFPAAMEQPGLWVPLPGCSHQQWLTQLVASLITSGGVTDEVLLLLKPVCLVKLEFCEELFPLLVHDILASSPQDFRTLLSTKVRLFFAGVSSHRQHPPSPSSHPHTNHVTTLSSDSIKTMINMVMYLRTVQRPKKVKGPSTPWDNNFWLDLDFLSIAMAAQYCSSYFTSLLCIEIWTRILQGSSDGGRSNGGAQPMEVDTAASDELSGGSAVTGSPTVSADIQHLLLEAYSHIGEPDSLYGACHSNTSDEMRVRLYEHEGEWHKALSTHCLRMQLPEAACEPKLAKCLGQLGLSHVLNMYLRGVGVMGAEGREEGVADYQYEAAWRCSIWEQEEGNSFLPSLTGRGSFHQSVFTAITALRDAEPSLLRQSLEQARQHVMSELCSAGLESTYSLYPFLSQLLCVLELEEAGAEVSLPSQDLPFLQDWKQRLPFLDSDFQFVEPILTLRCSVLHCLLSSATSTSEGAGGFPHLSDRRTMESVFAALTDTLLTLSTLAQEASKYQFAESALFNLKHLHSQRERYRVPLSLRPGLSLTLELEAAKLLWNRGEARPAMAQLRALLHSLESSADMPGSLFPTALCLYGSWLADTKSESPSVIMKRYLQRSVSLMEEQRSGSGNQEALVKAYLTLGRYADAQYQRIMRHLASPSYDAKKELLQKNKLEMQKLKSQVSGQDHLRSRHFRTLSAQNEEDEIAMANLLSDKQQFLEKALKNYILCLQHGDEHDLRVFRLCALWFANASSPTINELLQEGVARLESRKFLPLMYQLAARMSAQTLTSDPFQQILQKIILRSSVEHPYHCLSVILALSNASKDLLYPTAGHVTGTKNPGQSTGRLSRKNSVTQNCIDEDKVEAARIVLKKVSSKKPALVQAVEVLSDAYIDLAYHDVSAYRKQRAAVKLPASCPLLKLGGGRLQQVAVPTIDIEVDRTCRYDSVVTVESFDSFFSLAGGVNLPKILSCRGSDGRRRKQLVKGRDDLRQDAVMQQVFKLVNRLLAKEPSTSKRGLNIRTYKVIPLSQCSGVVEWCEGTQPLGEYLIGSPPNHQQGAHYRYRPSDLSSSACRKKLMSAGSDRKTSKYAVYLEISKSFKPVFHHFFMESFSQPPQWFERRLAYTRSVAASSIVSYLVGLGDRHVQNILIDNNTAEFIHIDLGVAFEQGKTLPTPETVPFRLTRDVVDGMGYSGVEGVFRRCCEETLALMRTHQEELRTIVEVLLHDPLHQWTVTPLKAMTLQQRAQEDTTSTVGDMFASGVQDQPTRSGSTNKMAKRVLLRLQEKLEGIEDGVPLSVSGQVTHLIQEASDPANLCLLFPGWQPWI